jgi:hypothetical protein
MYRVVVSPQGETTEVMRQIWSRIFPTGGTLNAEVGKRIFSMHCYLKDDTI